MIVGTNILHDGTGTTPYYTPTFPRGGLAAVFSFDATHKAGTPTMTINIEHKNAEDTSWTVAASITGVNATGVQTKDVSGIKEEVRISFVFTAGSAGDFFHVVIPEPAWRPY